MNEAVFKEGPFLGQFFQFFKISGMFLFEFTQSRSHSEPTGEIESRLVPAEDPGYGPEVLKALLALPRYRDHGAPFRAWLYRIALNEVRMYWRSNKGKVYMDLGAAETLRLLRDADLPDAEEELRALEGALGRLREAPAALIEMRYFDGMSFAEIGQVLGISEDAAKMRTHRVLGALRSSLGRKA